MKAPWAGEQLIELEQRLGPYPARTTEYKRWARLRFKLLGSWPQRVVDERIAQVQWRDAARYYMGREG